MRFGMNIEQETTISEICKDLLEQGYYPRAKWIDDRLIKLSIVNNLGPTIDLEANFEGWTLGQEIFNIFQVLVIPHAKKIIRRNKICELGTL